MLINVLIFTLIFLVNIYSFAQFKDANFLDSKFSFLNKNKLANTESIDSTNFYTKNYLKQKSSKVFVLSIGNLDYNIDSKLSEEKTNSMKLNTKSSKNFSLDVMIRSIHLFKSKIYLMPGIGIGKDNYHFKNKNLSISAGSDSLVFLSNRLITFYKYKLAVTYIQTPLLFGFQFGPIKKPINIQIGFLGGLNIATFTKEKYFVEQTKFKNKIIDSYHLNRYKLDGLARLYFGKIGIFGKYSFTSLFKKEKAPEVFPFTLGVTFSN